MIDEILSKTGVSYNDLSSEEYDTLKERVEAIHRQQKMMTVHSIREHIAAMRQGVETELVAHRDAPQSFLSLLCLFIPVVGIIRKWYQDQKELKLKARLQNYLVLEAFIGDPEKERQKLEASIQALKAEAIG